MDGPEPHHGGRPRLLNDSEKMRKKLFKLGKKGQPQRAVALSLGCCHDTLIDFFRRAPEAKAAHQRGLAEARKAKLKKGLAPYRVHAERASEPPLPGQTCNLCGQVVGGADGKITMDISELTGARFKLERLLDEYDARHGVCTKDVEEDTAGPE